MTGKQLLKALELAAPLLSDAARAWLAGKGPAPAELRQLPDLTRVELEFAAMKARAKAAGR